ncbi:MAG: hypothetical protein ACK4TI_02730, partial [Nitrososphaerales archaeon]
LPEVYEIAAKAMIVSRLLKLEGIYYMLKPFVNIHRDKVPKYLLGEAEHKNHIEFLWKLLYLKTVGDEPNFLDKVRLWWIRNNEVRAELRILIGLYDDVLDGVSFQDIMRLIGL